jgi:UDP-3-O-[3-hydroxymyristoyl] N-acetylglucosamine deacetylase
MHQKQRTLAKPALCSGVGVHSGKKVNLAIKPAPANHGIKFVRTDLPDNPGVPALFNLVVDTSLATVIGQDGVIVSTIEHMMAALAGLSIENAIVELDAYEMPIMDGSSGVYTELIKKAGIETLDVPRYFFVINEPIELKEDGKSVGIYPSPTVKISCSIEYDHPAIGNQSFEFELNDQSFEKEISRARTFGFLHEIEYLKSYGLARGASLETGIAINENGIMNKEGLRYKDEFVRHKILDCIGDFSLLGIPILGHIIAHKSGHAFNQAFLQKFFSQKNAWETRPVNETKSTDTIKSKSLAI